MTAAGYTTTPEIASARQLALAHWIERAVESGEVASYGEVARALGFTESRITQITALLGLSPDVQEAVLLGEGWVGIREAIRAGRVVLWGEQPALGRAPPGRATAIGEERAAKEPGFVAVDVVGRDRGRVTVSSCATRSCS